MLFRIIGSFLIFLSLSVTVLAADDTAMMSSVMKIKTYDRNSIDGNYTFSHYGSAVLIDNKRIITNAHVVLDADGKSPTGYYEVCRSEKNKKVPTCFTTAKLISYDTVADIAVLELASSPTGVKGAAFASSKELPVATGVVVYGYPSIGGTSITRTEGKIGGIDSESYKFDGTIDHGNSGGGAFGSDGKLVGMPYAVKSDNGMIGYIIPVSRIVDFLAGKTDNIEKWTTKTNSTFSTYIKSIQLLYKNPNSIKTKYVEIKNADKNGFTLLSAMSSNAGDIFMYYFFDKNQRVALRVSCSKDASIRWKDSIQFSRDIIVGQQKNKDTKTTISGSYTDASNTMFFTEVVDIKETKGERGIVASIAYKNAPTCAAIILAQDAKNKDKTSYQKAILLAKSLKFTNVESIQNSFISPFFSLKTIPNNTYIAQSPSFEGIQPAIGMIFSEGSLIFPSFEIIKFDDIDGYMNYGYGDSNQYAGKTYSFDDFFARYKTTGYTNVSDEVLTAKNDKKFVMTIENYSDYTISVPKIHKLVTFFYPFVTAEGEYRAYKIEFSVKANDIDVNDIRQLVESLELPGRSPFRN